MDVCSTWQTPNSPTFLSSFVSFNKHFWYSTIHTDNIFKLDIWFQLHWSQSLSFMYLSINFSATSQWQQQPFLWPQQILFPPLTITLSTATKTLTLVYKHKQLLLSFQVLYSLCLLPGISLVTLPDLFALPLKLAFFCTWQEFAPCTEPLHFALSSLSPEYSSVGVSLEINTTKIVKCVTTGKESDTILCTRYLKN